MSKKQKPQTKRSGAGKRPVLADHRRQGKVLLPPLSQLPNFQLLDWEGLYLPEHLWLAYLLRERDIAHAAPLFNTVCDLVDEYFAPARQEVFLGYVSDFGAVPSDRRREVVERLMGDERTRAAFGNDFRLALGLYPESPAAWLGLSVSNPEDALALVRVLVDSLRQARSEPTIYARILGLNRLFKHNRLQISREIADRGNLAEGLSSYPFTDDDTKARVEQFARMAMNMILVQQKKPTWGAEFWRRNFELTGCR